jgi:hypothetical protein
MTTTAASRRTAIERAEHQHANRAETRALSRSSNIVKRYGTVTRHSEVRYGLNAQRIEEHGMRSLVG